ncbi:MAG: class I SAM-dependent methyltransferase [Methyloligellaceae bacterium]
MPITTSMKDYYQARAPEYEDFYDMPERLSDLAELKIWFGAEAHDRSILEIACGTGYWTAEAAKVAKMILATDFNSAPLEIARSKGLGPHVSFAQADAYDLPEYDIAFDCGMAHFWWSHVAKSDQDIFLSHLAARLGNGATILMIDNNYIAGSNTPISHRDAQGDTYQVRTLSNGEQYEVLKNFPKTADIETAFSKHCAVVEVRQWMYFWAVKAVLKTTDDNVARGSIS